MSDEQTSTAPPGDPSPNPQTSVIIDLWSEGGDDFEYFNAAESEDWVAGFWAPHSPFQRLFGDLDLTTTLELACGAGRHSAQIVDRCERLVLTDTSAGALAKADARFADKAHVSTVRSLDGMTIPLEADGEFSAVFSFDALVHFELECVASYLGEISRLLRPGGRALIHHSNFSANPGGEIHQNPSWRNYMTIGLFAHLARRRGLVPLVQQPLDWKMYSTDALSLVEKPA